MTALLTVTGLTAGYRRREVLRDLTLAPLRGGELTALVGPNGAGKSTLLRALAGLVPARGTVRLDDQDLLALAPAKRAEWVTLMPQAIPQGIRLSVLEGVLGALHASALAVPLRDRGDAEARAMGALGRLGLTHLALAPLDQLSGGERQLASLAQALVREPRLLLLDEPTSALDLRHQAVVMGLARELAEEGRIVLVVLHDLTLAARWAHRIVALDRGALGAEGGAREAITPEVLARIYGVRARVEHCSAGQLQVMVDGVTGAERGA